VRRPRTLATALGVVCVGAPVAFAGGAGASAVRVELTEVARVYSLGVGEVRCASPSEWDADPESQSRWAYTNVRDEYAVLAPLVCEAALHVGGLDVPAWQQALGVLVLTHEAFHLRRWRYRRNEGKVECQALVYFKDAAQRLGATEPQAADLYPYALALHGYEVRLSPRYRDPACVVPPWAPPLERAVGAGGASAAVRTRPLPIPAEGGRERKEGS
jgi:hypothetical protein